MNIGLDIDGTVYRHPRFFAEFIEAMAARGHKFYCTSNHSRETWDAKDIARLTQLGIDPAKIDPSLMRRDAQPASRWNRVRMAEHCDYVFDDMGRDFCELTRTTVFQPLKPRQAPPDGMRVQVVYEGEASL